MVRKIHIETLRARAEQIARNLGKGPDEHLLIAEKLADAHARLGTPVIRPATDPAILKHYKPDGLASVTTIPVQRYIGHLPVSSDFQTTTRLSLNA